jgi:hypothetical protein
MALLCGRAGRFTAQSGGFWATQYPVECPIFCQRGLRPYDPADIKTHYGYAYCCCNLTPAVPPPLMGLDGDGGICAMSAGPGRLDFLQILCDCLAKARPFVVDFTAPHHRGGADKKLLDLRLALERTRREALAGLRAAAGDAEAQVSWPAVFGPLPAP